ncbi:hypothetical protein [Xanthomonas phage RTH11]|nr:hypothetical protein [Xanthomonas phage RTH11]
MTTANTAKILKLLAGTNIANRYRVHLNLYTTTEHYAKLAYHNIDHVRSVLNLFEVLRKLSGQHFSKDQLKAAELALAFHDIDHTGYPDTAEDENGLTNTLRAIKYVTDWALRNKIPHVVMVTALDLIDASAYPHEKVPSKRYGSEVNQALLDLTRDADILWGMMPGNAAHCMLGLWAESHNVGRTTGAVDIGNILTNQLLFLRNYVPHSGAGRTFKNAMADLAGEAFANAAIHYQRQLIAADAMMEMSDDEVLRLQDAIKRGVNINAELLKNTTDVTPASA